MVDMGIEDVQDRIYQLARVLYKRHGSLPVINGDSPEYEAWRRWRQQNGLPWKNWGKHSRVTIISQWPPADLDAFEREHLLSAKATARFRGD